MKRYVWALVAGFATMGVGAAWGDGEADGQAICEALPAAVVGRAIGQEIVATVAGDLGVAQCSYSFFLPGRLLFRISVDRLDMASFDGLPPEQAYALLVGATPPVADARVEATQMPGDVLQAFVLADGQLFAVTGPAGMASRAQIDALLIAAGTMLGRR